MSAPALPARTLYDQLPYVSRPFSGCHPEALAVSATLFGLSPPAPERARVLELGCAQGGNLLALAAAMPEARFVGVDSSEVQIEQGRAVVEALGLDNAELRCADIRDVDAGWGAFDYILCHGVWSWVPEEVRAHILGLCGQLLTPQGVAYVSYNTLPGWYLRMPLRQLMLFHAGSFDEPITRIEQARAALQFVASSVPDHQAVYRAQLQQLERSLQSSGDAYLFHEYLAPHNEPVFFKDFAAQAAGADLQFLAEVEFATMVPGNLSEEVAQTLDRLGGNLIATEQYLDFVRNRSFRQSLLVREALEPQRALTWRSVRPFRVQALLSPSEPPEAEGDGWSFELEGLEATVKTPSRLVRAAFDRLAELRSRSIAFEELLDEARAASGARPDREVDATSLASSLLAAYSGGALRFSLSPSELWASHPPPRPAAAPLAALQARSGDEVTSLRHQGVGLGRVAGVVFRGLDGSRTEEELADLVRAADLAGELPEGWADRALAAHPVASDPALAAVRYELGRFCDHGLGLADSPQGGR